MNNTPNLLGKSCEVEPRAATNYYVKLFVTIMLIII